MFSLLGLGIPRRILKKREEDYHTHYVVFTADGRHFLDAKRLCSPMEFLIQVTGHRAERSKWCYMYIVTDNDEALDLFLALNIGSEYLDITIDGKD
jgi:hypothetical protein